MNREQRRAAARRGRRMAAIGSASVLVASGASLVTGTLPAGGATTFHVTSLADTATPGTLRQAILDANANAGADIIDFQVTGTINLTDNLPTVTDTLDIQGPGAGLLTIDGQTKYHPFEIESSGNNAISGLTITHGDSNGIPNPGAPPPFYIAGPGVNPDNSGGGLAFYDAAGTLTISHMVITGNHAGNDGGGVWATGVDAVTVQDSTISGNTAGGGGGGLYLDDIGGATTIVNTTVSNNTAADDAGGLYLDDVNVEIRNSTVSGNTGGEGGGIFLNNGGGYTAAIANSTISGNTARSEGGGLYQYKGGVTLSQSTVTGNIAPTTGGIYTEKAGALSRANSKTANKTPNDLAKESSKPTPLAATDNINLVGTIVAGNTGNDLQGDGSTGVINSDHSLIGTVGSGTVVHDLGGTLLGVNPLLGALASNGGPTQTRALLGGSPAINAGPTTLPSFTGNANDQRGAGFARVSNGRVDIGAFEVQTVAITATPHLTG